MTTAGGDVPGDIQLFSAWDGGAPPAATELFDAAQRHNLECGWDWLALLAREVFAADGQAKLLTLQRQGRCLAAWALQCGAEPGALSNYYTALYEPLISAEATPDDLARLARHLRSLGSPSGRWLFGPMDPARPSFAALESALRAGGFAVWRFVRFGNWYLPCAGLRWADYLATRSGEVRSTIRRMGKRFDAAGGRLEIITGPDRAAAGLAAYEAVYASSWKQAEPYPGFVRGLVELAAGRQWLRLGVAWLGDRPIAAQIWLSAHRRAEIFKLAYDEQVSQYSAGTLLTARLMQQALDDDRVEEIDYLIGDDPYKKAWMTHRRERLGLVAYDLRRLAGIAGAAREASGRTLRRLRPRAAAASATPAPEAPTGGEARGVRS